MAIKPHISNHELMIGNNIADRAPHNAGLRDGAINQASQVLPDAWVARVQTGSVLLPIVGGNAEHASHRQRLLEDRLVVLDPCCRRDSIASNLVVVSEIQDPGDT